MKIAILADVHIGNHRLFGGKSIGGINGRCRDTIAVLGAAIFACVSDGAEKIVIAGDLFDSDLPSPALIRAVQEELNYAEQMGVQTIVVNGNHDMTSAYPLHTAVAPLKSDDVSVIETPELVTNTGLVVVPHQPGPATEWLPEALDTLASQARGRWPTGSPKLLVLHLGLEHAGTPPWLRGSHDSIHVAQLADLCVRYGIAHVVSGNWHSAWETTLRGVHMRQVGALVPTGFDNPGIEPYGRVVHWNTGTGFESDNIVWGPRFTKVGSLADLDEFAEDLRVEDDGNKHYIHAELPEYEYFAGARLLNTLRDEQAICQFKMSKPAADVRAIAEKAARAAQDAGSLGEALHNYVSKITVDEQVNRERLHQDCRRLLKLND